VTACVPASLNLIFETRLLEVMTVPIPDREGRFGAGAAEPVVARTEHVDSLVLGPGLGRDAETLSFAREVASRAAVPMVLDADGLNAHAGALEKLSGRQAPTILTPHAGELARLLDTDSRAIDAHRLARVRRAAAAARAIVLLKGDDTLIAEPDGRVAVSPGGSSALATAGTGDVLSGVIGAFLAKKMDPFHAACAGVLVHATAGRLAAERVGREGVIASDVIEALPGALAQGAARRGS
jgi:NAD(P)H-hydrate epimerase